MRVATDCNTNTRLVLLQVRDLLNDLADSGRLHHTVFEDRITSAQIEVGYELARLERQSDS